VNSAPAIHHDPRSRLLGRDYWLVTATPGADTTSADIAALVPDHVTWLLDLEEQGLVLASGPLTSGPGTGPGSGITVLRAPSEDEARAIAEQDPFVLAGLRTFVIQGWRLNEGSISVRVSLGTGTYEWTD
jgi:uncharacterized protein YciI